MHRDDMLVLERTVEFQKSESRKVVWVFGDTLAFKSLDNDIFDLTYSKSYDLLVKHGRADLRIGPGAITKPNGRMTIDNYGAKLSIEKIEPDRITLKYWWR